MNMDGEIDIFLKIKKKSAHQPHIFCKQEWLENLNFNFYVALTILLIDVHVLQVSENLIAAS